MIINSRSAVNTVASLLSNPSALTELPLPENVSIKSFVTVAFYLRLYIVFVTFLHKINERKMKTVALIL